MTYVNLASTKKIVTGNDNVVIVTNLETIPGGRTLDVTGFADTSIEAGHVIIKSDTGVYKPLPVTGVLPANHSYSGILVSTLETMKPQAAIMIRGTVNEAYCKYPFPSAAKTALNLISVINE